MMRTTHAKKHVYNTNGGSRRLLETRKQRKFLNNLIRIIRKVL